MLKDPAYLDLLIELISQVTQQVERALEAGVLTRFRANTGVSEADLSGFIQERVAKVAQESRDGAQFRP